tara:strand:- start:814 stop:1191 length:378 start_codon:yes stop_codon:yes gene_type:complete
MSTALLTESNQKKSSSKYLTAEIDPNPEYYLFVINLQSKKKFKKIQKISTDSTKYLIKDNEKIYFDKYNKLILEVTNLKNPLFNHTVQIDLSQNYIIHKNNYVYLEITNNNGYLTLFCNLANDIL